jgi:hypothetical protein
VQSGRSPAEAASTERPSAGVAPRSRVRAPTRLRQLVPLWFAALLACHWSGLDEPPVWDAAMSVFPAAITLAGSGFDLPDLLAQPGYREGGPNVHTLSIVTVATAAVYRLLGPRPDVVLPVLHLLHLAMAALALALLCRLAQRLLGDVAGLAVIGLVVLHPLVQAQTAAIYLEVPLLLAAAGAVDAWARGRPGQAVLWAATATLVKPTGAVVGIGLATATLLADETPLRRRLLAAAAFAPGAVLPILLQLALDPTRLHFKNAISDSLTYAFSAPDLPIVFSVYLVLAAVRRPWRRAPDPATSRAHLALAAVVAAFFAFFLFLDQVGSAVPILPRYTLMVLPLAAVGLAAVLALPRRPGIVVALALAAFFLANRRGAFYPESDNNFAVLERSLEYRDMLGVQLLGLRQLERLAPELPVYYGKPEHYKLRYPAMGYARGPLPHGHALDHELPWSRGRLEDFPPTFYVLVEYEWLGGEVGLDVLRQAAFDPRRRLQRTNLCVGQKCTLLARVDAAPAAPSR